MVKKRRSSAHSKQGLSFATMPMFQKILVIVLSLFIVWHSYLMLIVFIGGMLPTIVILITDKKGKQKPHVVGFFNLAGCIPYMVKIAMNNDMATFEKITTGPLNWIVVYGAAFVGLFIYSELPKIFSVISKGMSEARLKKIEEKLEKFDEEWSD